MVRVSPYAAAGLARLWAVVWRFGTLRLADSVFARAGFSPAVMCRPLYGFRLFVNVTRSSTQRLLYLEGERFIAEVNLVRSLIRPGMRVIDVGANIGYYVLLYQRVLQGTGQIICFEPERENLEELRQNVKNNGFGNVEIIDKAVGSRNGQVLFRGGINGIVVDQGSGDYTVQMTTLDSALREGADLIKIDVEGYECQVLEGGERTIRKYRPSMFVEIHPSLLGGATVGEILGFLKSYYGGIELYGKMVERGVKEKILARYCGRSSVHRIGDPDVVLRGGWRETFWAVCRKQDRRA